MDEPPPRGFSPQQWQEVCGEATALLQALLRIDTSNPPGQEREAARRLEQALQADGLSCEIIEGEPQRANLLCRITVGGVEPPLLLTAHLDTLPVPHPERWTHPPFGGVLAHGMLWGRGALDMKHLVAMAAMVLKLLARREVKLRRDLIFAAVADKTAGCRLGSRFLVEQHPDKVRAGYALGAGGGRLWTLGRARLLPVQTAEKGMCRLRLSVRGSGGASSVPRPESALVRLSEAVARLGTTALPHHAVPVVEAFVRQVAALQPLQLRLAMPHLLSTRLSEAVLRRFFPEQTVGLRALLHNTVTPLLVRASEAPQRIPELALAELDGRTLPGQEAVDLLREVRALLGEDCTLELLDELPAHANYPPDSPLWDCIRSVIHRHDRSLTAVPCLLPGFTDGTYFSQLGARWYGFAPLRLAPLAARSPLEDLEAGEEGDEGIPEDGFHWGLRVLYDVVDTFCVRDSG